MWARFLMVVTLLCVGCISGAGWDHPTAAWQHDYERCSVEAVAPPALVFAIAPLSYVAHRTEAERDCMRQAGWTYTGKAERKRLARVWDPGEGIEGLTWTDEGWVP